MEPELPPENIETTYNENLDAYLQTIISNQESNHLEMVELTTELVASNYHIRELSNNIMVGLGLVIALAILTKIIKIFI